MGKKKKIKRTLAEQILEKHQIPYESVIFETKQVGDVQKIEHGNVDESIIYKTLALIGTQTGPIIGVVPIDKHLNEKKFAQVTGNKKVSMIPQKELQKTTGYVHGANNPVGIWMTKHFPITIDALALDQKEIIVSAGEIGRSLKINAEQLGDFVEARFENISD